MRLAYPISRRGAATVRFKAGPYPHADAAAAHGDGPAAWRYWPVAGVLALAWLVFAAPWLSGAVTIPWDAKAHFAPQVQFLAQSLARGELPFWSPNVFAGHPQIADPQSMMFSPPMLLLALLNGRPSLWAIDATVLGVLLGAGLGVLWLARDLGWHWLGALVAALAFAFGASMAWRLQHFGQVMSLAYFPFALVMLRRALREVPAASDLARASGRSAVSRLAWGAGAGLVSAFIVLGRDQVGLLCIYLLVLYVLWHWATAERPAQAIRASLGPLLAGGLVGVGVIALPLLMTVLLAASSNRPAIDFAGAGAGSLHPALLVTAVVPQLFGAAGEMANFWGPPSYTWVGTGLFTAQNMGQLYLGAVPVLALGAGLAAGLYWRGEIAYFAAAFVLVTLYALGWFTPVFALAYHVLPGVSLYRRPADATFMMGGLGALLAGYAVHRAASGAWPRWRPWQMAVAAGVPVGGMAFALGCALAYDRLALATGPLAEAVGWLALAGGVIALAAWLAPIRPLAAGLLVVAVTAADLARNNGPNGASALPTPLLSMLEPASPSQLVATLLAKVEAGRSDTRRDRVELAGLGFHWPNASLTHNLDNTLGYNPVRLGLYTRVTGAGDTVGLPDQRTFTPLMPSYRSLTADLLGLRYIATGVRVERMDPKLKPGDLILLAVTPDGFIYENPRAYPRALFATRAVAADFEAILASGRWPLPSLLDSVLLEPTAGDTLGGQARRPGRVSIARYTNTEVVITADSPDGGWVVLNDVWHPWWRAEIDGQPATLMRANVLVRAVEVPSGRHIVRFQFAPVTGALSEAARLLSSAGRSPRTSASQSSPQPPRTTP